MYVKDIYTWRGQYHVFFPPCFSMDSRSVCWHILNQIYMYAVITASSILVYAFISISRYDAYLNAGFGEGSAKFSSGFYKE